MKFYLCALILLPNFAVATPATLEIYEHGLFYSASGPTVIQGGSLKHIREVDPNQPFCTVHAQGHNPEVVSGDLGITTETGQSRAAFLFEDVAVGRWLQLNCSVQGEALSVESINETLRPIAGLR